MVAIPVLLAGVFLPLKNWLGNKMDEHRAHG